MIIMKFIYAITLIFSIYSIKDLADGYPNEFPTKLKHSYRKEIRFSDWRNVGNVDYVTNLPPYLWYNKKYPAIE